MASAIMSIVAVAIDRLVNALSSPGISNKIILNIKK